MDHRRKSRRLPKLNLRAKGNVFGGEKHLVLPKLRFDLKTIVDPGIQLQIQKIKRYPIKTIQDVALLCILRFRQIKNVIRRIPKTKKSWLNLQLQIVRQKMGHLKYLTDKDLKRIIIQVRHMHAEKSREKEFMDPDLPSCFYWSVEQVGQWLRSIGFPHLTDMFASNFISGRKLITIDASALNKMGLKYFNEIQELASKIREILKIHRPNMMRALMRKVPFELYLKQRQFSGKNYDDITFENFCQENGYPYQILKENPLALIECTCELSVYFSAIADGVESDEDVLSDHNSLILAPTVEFTLRHILVRDKVVSEIINELLELTYNAEDPDKREARLKRIFEEGFQDLGLSSEELAKRIKFGRLVAEEMLLEAKRTQEVLQDINKFRLFLKDENISEETMEHMREIASRFFNSATNVGSLLALGELDLDPIFRQQPEFNAFVDGMIEEAETKLNEVVPEVAEFVDDIIEEVRRRLIEMDLPYLDEEGANAVRLHADSILDSMSIHGVLSVEEAKRRESKDLESEETGSSVYVEQPELSQPGAGDMAPESPPPGQPSPENSTRVAYFTVHYDAPDEILGRKLRGEAEGGTSNKKTCITSNFVQESGDAPCLPASSTYGADTYGSANTVEDPTTNFKDLELEEDSETQRLILDVISEVIQEAITQVLLKTTSAKGARRLMLCLEKLKNFRILDELTDDEE